MKVYAVYCNENMTDGCGSMELDKVFLHREHAVAYIDTQEGVMGRRQKWSEEENGDWEIQEIEVIEENIVTEVETQNTEEYFKQQAIKSACDKLTSTELKALGIMKRK